MFGIVPHSINGTCVCPSGSGISRSWLLPWARTLEQAPLDATDRNNSDTAIQRGSLGTHKDLYLAVSAYCVTVVSPNCSRQRSIPRCRHTVSNSNLATMEWLDFSSACHVVLVAKRQAGHLDDRQHLAPTASWWLCGGVVGPGTCRQSRSW